MRILQVSHSDRQGGAEAVALALHRGYRAAGHDATLAVGRAFGDEPGVHAIEQSAGGWGGLWWGLHARFEQQRRWRAARISRIPATPGALLDLARGHEDFRFPGTARLLDRPGGVPDVLQLHNLHGGYFDLNELPALSRRVPMLLTLHDQWLTTGHCALPLDCERWRSGCGSCPYLDAYPALRVDGTAANRRRKNDIYRTLRAFVAVPADALLRVVEQSILAPAVVEARVIPNGVDLTAFAPGDRSAARRALGLPDDAEVAVFSAQGSRSSPYKDYPTLRAALARVGDTDGREFVAVALGDDGSDVRLGRVLLSHRGSVAHDEVVAYLRAASMYVHPARADTHPLAVLEALAVGTPVVASAVGGIPEQVRDGETGLLVPPRDPRALAEAIGRLEADPTHAARLGAAGLADARARFDVRDQVRAHLDWLAEIATGAERAR